MSALEKKEFLQTSRESADYKGLIHACEEDITREEFTCILLTRTNDEAQACATQGCIIPAQLAAPSAEINCNAIASHIAGFFAKEQASSDKELPRLIQQLFDASEVRVVCDIATPRHSSAC